MERQIGRLHPERQALASLICLQLIKKRKARINMPKYVIEREVPGIGNATEDQVRSISQKSCNVLNKLGPTIQWLHSYVTADKIYCVYIAPDENMIREHAEQGGFPANCVSEIKSMIDPTTAE
jgi:Nickel responsive protein SCO4226-like